MKRKLFAVLRMLALLATLTLALASVSTLYDSIRQLQARSASARETAAQLAQAAATEQRRVIERGYGALKTIAGLSSIGQSGGDCGAFFSRRLEDLPGHVRNLGLARLNGEVVCSTHALPGPVPLPARSGSAMALLVSGAKVGLPQSQGAIVVGAPLSESRRRPRYVVFAVLGLARMRPFPATVALPPGAALTLFNRSGTAATYDPARHQWTAPGAAAKLPFPSATASSAHTETLTGADGIRRLYAFAAVAQARFGVALGIPAQPVFAPPRRRLYLQVAWLAILIISSVPLAGVGGDRFLKRQIGMLAAAAQRARHHLTGRRRTFSAPLAPFLRRLRPAAKRNAAESQTKMELRRANERLRHSVALLQRRTRDMAKLGEMGRLLQTCTDSAEVAGTVARFAQELFFARAGALFTPVPGQNMIEARTMWGHLGAQKEVFSPHDCWALRLGRVHRVAGPASGPHCPHIVEPPSDGYACLPLLAQGEVIGIVHLQGCGALSGSIGEREARQLAQAFSEAIAQVLANLQFRETLRAQSIRDPLTGLYNRRFMEETLAMEERRAIRNRSSVGIVILDIDRFKRINDSAGHDAGDVVLRKVGDFLREQVREGDIPCRYGGEEFIVILPGATLEVSRQRAEEMRHGIAALRMEYQGKPLGPVTTSIGAACLPHHGASWQAVLKAADEALYRAKHDGRNRVAVA